ncbi:hypothetical protein [Methylobacterium durans]|uniref:Uncharacterized protein n=1 Tax=Methylobacterium durans TaxID=2202825 RepID=A0A2U8W1J3_9HYPH|nr:hypothetical protein [Methylobacterium durans]AWN39528.1 hypothetical protein DK389_02000 [Methylobacterium durans]
MHSDLEHARRAWDRAKSVVQQLESRPPDNAGEASRHQAELHLARLRAYMAQGRVIALQRGCLAHKACEDAPRERLRAPEAFAAALAEP